MGLADGGMAGLTGRQGGRHARRAALALTAALFLLAAWRALAFWAHEPMLAYANNYDQVRVMKPLGIRPDAPGVPNDIGTEGGPWRYFVRQGAMEMPFYPSSDLAFKWPLQALLGALAPQAPRVDVKVQALCLLAVWLAGMAVLLARLMRASAGAALALAAWLLLVTDPVNLLFLNTWYFEFSAFALLTALTGMACLWLAGGGRSRGCVHVFLALLLLFAANRNQYAYLPLALLPLGLLAWPRLPPWARGRSVALAALLVVLAPPLLFSEKVGNLKGLAAVNRINTFFGAMLPAASDPPALLRRLDLGPDCLRFSGGNFFRYHHEWETACPGALQLSLRRMAPLLAADPPMLGRMIGSAIGRHQGFVQAFLGQVQGVHMGQLQTRRAWPARSLDEALRALPAPAWQGLAAASLWLPALAALWALGRARRPPHAPGRAGWGWLWAWLALLLCINYVFFSALLGDGYYEIQRHALLCYSLGCLVWVAWAAWLTRLCASRTRTGNEKEACFEN